MRENPVCKRTLAFASMLERIAVMWLATCMLLTTAGLRTAMPWSQGSRAAQCSRRAVALLAEQPDPLEPPPEEDAELMADLRKALGNMDSAEMKASDERVLDGFVDDRKGVVSAFEEDFGRQLDAVQEGLESRIEGELQSVQSDFLSRIDAAVSDLRQADGSVQVEPGATASADGDGLATTDVPPDGLVVIAGASTALGGEMLRAIGASGYRLRALVPDGKMLEDLGVEVESVPYAPFAPTALGKSLSSASAVVLVMSAAGGAGGIEAEAVPKIVKALDASTTRRVIMVSIHGVGASARRAACPR